MAQAAVEQKQSKCIDVSRKDLPLRCPGAGTDTAAMHPKVYLPVEKTGEAVCPYCGAHYRLVD